MNIIEELRWRGMIHNIMPGTEELLKKPGTAGYIGFDPTSDSLHIGSLVQIMTLVHYQRAGHKPIALVGGATGMVGDPSGKSRERNLLSEEEINVNLIGIKKQLERFLDFDCRENSAEIVNNYDWFKDMSFLDFIRDTGKHISINYMLAKDSVKSRMESGMSFTEFTYQLVQAYDFYWLFKNKGCAVQLGGSDQWGNIVSGTELIRRKCSGEAYAVTTPLIKKADGTKFGKTEEGNVWLDKEKTSPYKFYQYWLNASDEDTSTYLRIFTLKTKKEIESLEKEHANAPHLRIMQKALAEEITCRVHSREAFEMAVSASNILFGKSTEEELNKLDEQTFLNVFEGVPTYEIAKERIKAGIDIANLLAEETDVFKSKGEFRRMLQGGGLSINKSRQDNPDKKSDSFNLIANKYLLVQKGKKSYSIIVVV